MVRGADPGDASVDKTSLFVCSLAVETLDAGEAARSLQNDILHRLTTD